MEKPISKERIFQADVIRVIAMLFVILMHTVLNFTLRGDFFATPIWFLLEPVVIFARSGVSLFFMLSGYLVISKQRSIQENLQKLWHRLLIPLVAFEVITILYRYFVHYNSEQGSFVQQQLQRLFTYPSSPLWFIEVLAFLYLLNPLWSLLFVEKKSDTARYVTLFFFLFSVVATLWSFALGNAPLFTTFTAWTGYLCFYLYGGLIRKEWVKINNTKVNVLVLAGSFGAALIGDYIASSTRSIETGLSRFDYTGNYLSIPIILLSLALFNILIQQDFVFPQRGTWGRVFPKAITWLSGLSFGIYLVHVFVVGVLIDILGFDFNKAGLNVYVFNLINVVLVLGFSIVITWVIQKIPLVRKAIGER